MKRVIVALLAAFLLAAAPLPKEFRSIRGLSWTDDDGSVGNHCTLWSVNEKDRLFVTAAHCVAQPHDFQVDGRLGSVVKVDVKADLALMTFPLAVDELRLAEAPARVGDAISLPGFPLGFPFPVLSQGNVAATNGALDGTPYLLFDINGCGGVSGAPVLNKWGEVISVLQIGLGRPPCGGFMGGAPLAVLKAFLGVR